jgi:predicted SnoaL-like aldol condensation-catalyzing enzyme
MEENKAIVRRWHEVFNKKNLEGIDELIDPQYVNYGSDFRGLEAIKERFRRMISEKPDLQVVTEDTIAEGDKVVTRWTWYEGGRAVFAGISIHRIAGGKIIEDWFYSKRIEQ